MSKQDEQVITLNSTVKTTLAPSKIHGVGVFALYDHGKPVGFFAHRRIREKPPSGGVSVLSESILLAEGLRSLSQRL